MYNWKLYEDFVAVAQELDLNITSQDGGCLYLELPNNLKAKFWAMLWTPLNKLDSHCDKFNREQYKKTFNNTNIWNVRLDDFRQNHTDFHLEFCNKSVEDGNYYWFPEVNFKAQSQITQSDIKSCVQRMLDEANYEQHMIWAKLQEPPDNE